MESPAVTYQRALAALRPRLAQLESADRFLGYAKVAVFLAGMIAAVLLLRSPQRLPLLFIPAVGFVILLAAHNRVLARLSLLRRSTDFYHRGLTRLNDQWAGTGEAGDRFLDAAHPYARDLDLFGHGSLFDLLCTARTRAGEETLARWLLHPATPDEVRTRHEAILEMKDRVDFRERLFITGESVRAGVHPNALAAWGEQTPVFSSRWLPILLSVLTALWIAALANWIFGTAFHLTLDHWFNGDSWNLLLSVSLVNFSVALALNRRVTTAAGGVEKATADLKVLAEVLEVMERESFNTPRLRTLRESLATRHTSPSAAIRRLRRIVEWIEARRNLLLGALHPFVFLTAHLVFAVERWQRRYGPAIRNWLAAVGEFEALASLAGYAFEHPEHTLPEFVKDSPSFEAEDLAHPLLPGKAVGNDLVLNHATRLLIISGPNMAGKSTFLRGIGLNAVLAQCGAPVRARRLRLSPLAVGASICILDSLQGGVSRFYAEIRRLKLLSDLARGPIPLLFLLDELLSGTNSHDRYDGTRFIVESFVRQRAIGLVTTHDLALTRIPETMNGLARNGHFEDTIENGQLRFDYRLRPGIVQTSNALRLMQAIGLEVGDSAPLSASAAPHSAPGPGYTD